MFSYLRHLVLDHICLLASLEYFEYMPADIMFSSDKYMYKHLSCNNCVVKGQSMLVDNHAMYT